MRSVGLDLGAHEISYCEVSGGEVVVRRTVRRLEALDDLLGPKSAPATVAVEACRESWHVHDTLTSYGHKVLVIDTTRLHRIGIGEHGRKNDRLDAEHHARAVENGKVPLAHILSPERRKLREQLDIRRALVETRAHYITSIRGLARARGERIPSCRTPAFLGVLQKTPLTPETRTLVQPLTVVLESVDSQIAVAEDSLRQLAHHDPTVQRLATAPGVASIVAVAFVSVIDDAGRFRNAHQVESYLGLVPTEATTGGRGKQRLGAITKKGNSYLRTMLVQAAWAILRSGARSDPLAKWGRAVVKRRGKRVGVVAVARRLAGILWAMWKSGTVYEPSRIGASGAEPQNPVVQDVALLQAKKKLARVSSISNTSTPAKSKPPRRKSVAA